MNAKTSTAPSAGWFGTASARRKVCKYTNRTNDKEKRIRNIAHYLYLESKKDGFVDNPDKNWKEAESIYKNKLKYFWWGLCKYYHGITALVAMLSLVINIVLVTWNVMESKTSTDLSNRPYVSINMENPKQVKGGEDVFYGNNIILKNKGKTPAAKVVTQYYITSDMDKENMNGLSWFEENLGGFGSTSFISPDAIEIEPGFRSLSPSAEYYYFEACTAYEGMNTNRRYWTHIRKVFYVDKNTSKLYPVSIYGEWDRNKHFQPPQVANKEQVLSLIEGIKKKKIK